MINVADYYTSSAHVKPDWRWSRVLSICDKLPRPGRPKRTDDLFIRQARTFLLRWRGANSTLDPQGYRQELFLENPGLYLAFELNDKSSDEPTQVHLIQARILAGQNNQEIALKIGTTAEAIDWYEQLFFHIRPKLRQTDWIYSNILLPSCIRQAGVAKQTRQTEEELNGESAPYRAYPIVNAMMDMTLKLFAYYYGPVMLEFMIGGIRPGTRVSSADQIPTVLSEHFSDTVLRRAAQAATMFAVTKFNVTQLFDTATKIMDLKLRAEDMNEGGKTTVENILSVALGQIPWSVNRQGQEMLRDQAIGEIDDSYAELRDEELLLLSAGEKVEGLDEIASLQQRILEPTKK